MKVDICSPCNYPTSMDSSVKAVCFPILFYFLKVQLAAKSERAVMPLFASVSHNKSQDLTLSGSQIIQGQI